MAGKGTRLGIHNDIISTKDNQSLFGIRGIRNLFREQCIGRPIKVLSQGCEISDDSVNVNRTTCIRRRYSPSEWN